MGLEDQFYTCPRVLETHPSRSFSLGRVLFLEIGEDTHCRTDTSLASYPCRGSQVANRLLPTLGPLKPTLFDAMTSFMIRGLGESLQLWAERLYSLFHEPALRIVTHTLKCRMVLAAVPWLVLLSQCQELPCRLSP